MQKNTAYPIPSEAIEPFAAMLTGRMFARCEEAKARNDGSLEGQLMSFWWVLAGLNKISIGVETATHFSIAVMNEQNRLSRYIQHELGIDPFEQPSWN